MPEFPIEDSNEFQRALTTERDSDNSGTRIALFTALAYSSPPENALDTFLRNRVETRSDVAEKSQLLEVLANSGRKPEWATRQALDILKTSTNSKARHLSALVLGDAKPEAALDDLIRLASEPSASREDAVQTLAAYGSQTPRAITALETLAQDPSSPENIRNLARVLSDPSTSGRPQFSRLNSIKVEKLWPLAADAFSIGSHQGEREPAPASTGNNPAPAARWRAVIILVSVSLGAVWIVLKKRR